MNVVPVDVADGALRSGGFELSVPGALTDELRARGRVIAGLRPEDLELANGTPGDREGRLRAVVEVVEYLGDEQLLHLDSGGVRLVAKLPSDPRARPQDELELALPLAKLHVFDAESERALPVGGAVAS
jgi:multiple sugar transport system ATP-binding protein